MEDFDKKWMKMIYKHAAEFSDNPKTQTGAAIISKNQELISIDTNRFPCKIPFDESKLESPDIYSYLNHAEEGGIKKAVKEGFFMDLEGSVIYTFWVPCDGCARDIIDYGLAEVVMHKELNDFNSKISDRGWGQDESLEMFRRAGVKYRFIEGKLFEDDFKIKFRGYDFSP